MSTPETFRVDRRAVQRAFDRASHRRAAAPLVEQVRGELLERVHFFKLEPRVILDLGCGTGAAAAQLRRRFARAQVIALDSAYLMAHAARRGQRFWRRFECVCADASALPLRARSVDLVFSNLMLQWCDDPQALFSEVQRVLRPGGLLLFSTLGPETLQELRTAWMSADTAVSHVSAFADMTGLAQAMSRSGLSEPVMDREVHTTHYPEVRALMSELRALGATHAGADRRRSLTGRARLQAMIEAYEGARSASGIPASWEIIYGTGFAGTTAAEAEHSAGEEFAVSAAKIRTRDRSP
jgi:malonyl-CoA O-methyltransferase